MTHSSENDPRIRSRVSDRILLEHHNLDYPYANDLLQQYINRHINEVALRAQF